MENLGSQNQYFPNKMMLDKNNLLDALSGLVKNTATIDEKIRQYTSFDNMRQFVDYMNNKAVSPNVELLLGTKCNLDCKLCFFQGEKNYEQCLDKEIQQLSEIMSHVDPDALLYLYPREISLAKNILPLMKEIGQKFTLSNGIYSPDNAYLLFNELKKNGITEISFSFQSNPNIFSDLYGIDQHAHIQLKNNISKAKEMGFQVNLYTEIYKKNYGDVLKICQEAEELGASIITFLRVVKMGNATKIADEEFISKYTLSPHEMEEFVLQLSQVKKNLKIRAKLSAGFGINFYSSGVFNYYLGKKGSTFFNMNIRNHCPAVDNLYHGVSIPSGNIYPCFMLQAFPETQIGKLSENGKIDITKNRIDKNELIKNLDGICSSSNCENSSLCLGGCRSAAYVNAKMCNHPTPKYAGMDICITNTIKNMIKQ